MQTRTLLLASMFAFACRAPDKAPGSPHPVASTAPAAQPAVTVPRTLLDELSLLTTGAAASEATMTRWTTDLAGGIHSTDDVIEELMRDPRFLNRITKVFLWDRELYLGIARYDRAHGWILKQTEGAAPLYYVREACDPAVAEDVHPWWAMKTTVKVCPDTHRPTVLWMDKNRACSASAAAPDVDKTKTCGCGPNLMRCSPDEATYQEFRRQFLAEIEDTVADVVDRDLPLKTVYLTNETIRKPLAQLQYDSWRVERGELAELPDNVASWPAAGKRAARYEDMPGDHAGILTTIGGMWLFGGLRPWIRTVQQSMWCSNFDNSHVESKALFDAAAGGNANLRGGEGWKLLANHPVCGSCHARMDYGWQFFLGYPDFPIATHFIPPKGKMTAKLHAMDVANAADVPDARLEMGNLYVDNFADMRGQRQKQPIEYAKWAVEQPEFRACAARRVSEHVLGPDARPEDREAVAAVFGKTERFRPMMREALRRFVQQKLKHAAEPETMPPPTFLTAVPSTTSLAPDAMITVMPETRVHLERFCLDCHGTENDDPNKNFDATSMSRDRMMMLLSYVADGRMPKTDGGLDPLERQRLMSAMVSNLWATDSDRRSAYDYYDQRFVATTVQRPDAVLSVVYGRGGAVPATPVSPMLEITIPSADLQFTPGLAAHIAVEALRACKAAHAPDLGACVDKAMNVEGIVRPQ